MNTDAKNDKVIPWRSTEDKPHLEVGLKCVCHNVHLILSHTAATRFKGLCSLQNVRNLSLYPFKSNAFYMLKNQASQKTFPIRRGSCGAW
ncbi:Os03g0229575 [Oryza sativa Japonica Group]|uniref:Os03g0229575 protein n=1 Tax=Oryza sativa subsp. japonica TaxID=39947 RepID=A0A0P0VV12_ORYSJ|nr:hypothetical protein EE612_016274 [Oryza sativa]BAS83093.1 Os03g0229575 [Oryza sativa Japonica Group]